MADGDTTAQKLLIHERGPGRNFDLYEATNHHNLYVDGLFSVSFGPTNSRVDFFRVVRIEGSSGSEGQPVEIRERSVTLTLPTMALAEFMSQAVAGLRAGEEQLVQSMEGLAPTFRRFLNSLGAPDASG